MVLLHSTAMLIISETKVGGLRAKDIVERLPFDGAICTNTIGFTGGLWLLWDSNCIEVTELTTTEQEIHVLISINPLSQSWLFSTIYASPRYAERQLFWDNLSTIANLHSLPWAIAGDFNEILMSDDKFGGRNVNINRALRFQDCLDNCKMQDIGFTSPALPGQTVDR